ncbi:hypothetical protein [Paraurantiacibacter namhicola]|nr:hypothetical protein [Paraurantiacibacter namhicola]
MTGFSRTFTRPAIAAIGLVALAACATPPPPPPPPPPAPTPTPTPIPPRPTPPNSAMTNMDIPLRNAYGQRQTVNANLTTAETVWNLRSGMNVAALNCLDPEYEPILTAYTKFLGDFSKDLSRINRELDAMYKDRHGSTTYKRERDTQLTGVYNYFALPPATRYFCEAALQVANNYLALPPTELEPYALETLPVLEGAFERFYSEYEAYQAAVLDWDARYGEPVSTSVYAQDPVTGVSADTMGGTPQPAIDAPIVDSTPLPAGTTYAAPPADEPVVVLGGQAGDGASDMAPATPPADPAPQDQPATVSRPVVQELPSDTED